jgi:hypothetical protein
MDSQQTGRGGQVTVIIGLILVVVGGYYVLRNTIGIDLPPLDSDAVVPIIAVAIGSALLYRASRRRTATSQLGAQSGRGLDG